MEDQNPFATKQSTPNSSGNRSLFCVSPSNRRIDMEIEAENNSLSSSARSLFLQIKTRKYPMKQEKKRLLVRLYLLH